MIILGVLLNIFGFIKGMQVGSLGTDAVAITAQKYTLHGFGNFLLIMAGLVVLNSFFRLIALRGFITFVNTMPGPKKTSSSQITPS